MMKFTVFIFLILPLLTVAQGSKANSISPRETISYIKALDSLDQLQKREIKTLGYTRDSIDYIKLLVEKLTNAETYNFLKSDEISATEKLDYILAFNGNLKGLFIYMYRDYKGKKDDDIIKVFHWLSQTNIAQYSLLEKMVLNKEIYEPTFQMAYMHPVLDNTFLILEIDYNSRDKSIFNLETISNDICELSSHYFSFYKRYKKKIIDVDWLQSYDWKQKSISTKHGLKCVRESALKNL